MKKIEAIIRKTKFQEVKETLHANGIDFFTYFPATGVGKAVQSRVYRGVAYDTSSIERLMIEIVVRDSNLEKTVHAIMEAAKTGEIGDGKIFISEIQESYRIRTGEKGDRSLYSTD
jgi:nitrogen regulatory protein P-II 1